MTDQPTFGKYESIEQLMDLCRRYPDEAAGVIDWFNRKGNVDRSVLLEAERRGFEAARLATNGCVISMDYSEGGGPQYPRFADYQREVNSKEGASDE